MTKQQGLDLLSQHIPSISEADELELEDRRYNTDTDQFGQPEMDVADLAVRTCRYGAHIDGYYEYVDHLKTIIEETM